MESYRASATEGPRCSAVADALGEALGGTSAVASTWLCIEQPGPWGRDAVADSHLDPEVGRELAERARGTGVRIALIRRAGHHPDRHQPVPRRVYLAHTAPGHSWLEGALVADPKELLDLDLAAAGAGMPAGFGQPVASPLLLVCTNGRRDVCCALFGRPIATALAARHGDRVWECSHTGGHRFAPTAVTLPDGYLYGRLDVTAAERLLDPDTGVLLDHCRGRSTWVPAAQAAELAVRAATGDRGSANLRVAEPEPLGANEFRVIVSHVDGRRWSVGVAERTSDELRSASCGDEPTPIVTLHAEILSRDL